MPVAGRHARRGVERDDRDEQRREGPLGRGDGRPVPRWSARSGSRTPGLAAEIVGGLGGSRRSTRTSTPGAPWSPRRPARAGAAGSARETGGRMELIDEDVLAYGIDSRNCCSRRRQGARRLRAARRAPSRPWQRQPRRSWCALETLSSGCVADTFFAFDRTTRSPRGKVDDRSPRRPGLRPRCGPGVLRRWPGCKLARRYADRITLDFFGDQVVVHLSDDRPAPLYPPLRGDVPAPRRLEAAVRLARLRKLRFFEAVHRFTSTPSTSRSCCRTPGTTCSSFERLADPRVIDRACGPMSSSAILNEDPLDSAVQHDDRRPDRHDQHVDPAHRPPGHLPGRRHGPASPGQRRVPAVG